MDPVCIFCSGILKEPEHLLIDAVHNFKIYPFFPEKNISIKKTGNIPVLEFHFIKNIA